MAEYKKHICWIKQKKKVWFTTYKDGECNSSWTEWKLLFYLLTVAQDSFGFVFEIQFSI